MEAPETGLRLNFDVSVENLVFAFFTDEVLRRGLRHLAMTQWQTASRLEELGALASRFGEDGGDVCVELATGLGLLSANYSWVHAYVAASSSADARAGLDELRRMGPPEETREEHLVPVTFWSAGMHGPTPMRRDLEVPTWREIELNYPEPTHAGLERLMAPEFRPARGGQLLLWHGETGTGKTTALRALAREWKDWCTLHYITDPEKFFGEHADYMLTVMVQGQMEAEFGLGDDDFEAGIGLDEPGAHGADTWRLLVLEDAGELLGIDARVVAGQALSRFLNAVDGLIGQGLRFLVLVTTNEELGKLHPAVARPGRAAARIEFGRLAPREAEAWLERNEAPPLEIRGPMTLAALYAHLEGLEDIPASQPLGF